MNKVERAIRAFWREDEGGDDLVRRYRTEVYRLAYSITASNDAAEDVAQEVCRRIVRSRSTIESAERPWGWIRTVTVRCALSNRRRPVEAQLPDDLAARADDPAEPIAVAQTLARLSPDHRAVLALAIYEQLSYQEIAEALDIPVGSVGSRLHYAKEQFRRFWEEA